MSLTIKKITIFLAATLGSFAGHAQIVPVLTQTAPSGTVSATAPTLPAIITGSRYNYTRTYTPMIATTNAASLTTASDPTATAISVAFTDGFGSTMQTISRRYSNNKNLVTFADTRFLNEGRSYLPFAYDDDYFRTTPAYTESVYYGSRYADEGNTALSKTEYYSSSTTRETRTYLPGKSQYGQNRYTTEKKITNSASQVRYWGINSSNRPTSPGFYALNELAGSEVLLINGGRKRTFKDRDGKLLYEAVLLEGSTEAITQYVYDDMGRLRFILPPRASASVSSTGSVTAAATVTDSLTFENRYDSKGRLTLIRKPGEAGFTEMVYDRKDRVVMRRSPVEKIQGIWELVFYDKQDRAISTSLYTNSAAQADWQTNIDGTLPTTIIATSNILYYLGTTAGEGVYPSGVSGNDVVSYNFYDHYNYTTLNAAFADAFMAAEFTEDPVGAESSTQSKLTNGKLTGSKVKIIKAGGTGTELGDWIESVVYYDKKGRVLQTRTRNPTKSGSTAGKEIISNYYNFRDQLLMSIHGHQNKKTGHEATEYIRYNYDTETGRLVNTSHKVNEDTWKLLNSYTYDDLGRVARKIQGNYGEVQDYSYGLRGELTGINKVYAETGNKEYESRSFGASLKYDYGYSSPGVDGKLGAFVWRGAGGNARAYGYTYDLAGRLKSADYTRWTVNTTYPSGAWINTAEDYSVSNIVYDANSNMQSMRQRGMGIPDGGSSVVPVTMDDLSYTYATNSNRLARVEDAATNYNLGDFGNGNTGSNDYAYDNSGNLTKDLNKNITAITYTWFNKPQVVTFGNGNTIKYLYDASGNKVQELVTIGSTVKRTDYIANFTYENDVLQFISTSEGRTVYNTVEGSYKEEFFVKDHIGNVRSVVDVMTYDPAEYLATYEVASAELEGLVFARVSEIAEDNPDSPDPSNLQSGLLNGSTSAGRVGTSLLLRVMAGDRVEMNVNTFFNSYNPAADAPVSASTMMSSIISTLTGGAGGWAQSESHNPQLINQMFNSTNYTQFANIVSSTTDPTKPKAYLNYILFNEQMQMVGSFSGAYQANGLGTWGSIGTSEPMEIPMNGYLAVYLGNESTHDVHFDQMIIRMTKGRLLEETHYYPHGLPMANAGSSASGYLVNKVKHQGNQYNKDAGLNWMNFNFRQYDPQIGRFLSVDLLAANTPAMSPYLSMDANPAMRIDPMGLQGFENLSAKLYNYVSNPLLQFSISEGRKSGAQSHPNAPGGTSGWFMMLSIAMSNNASAAAAQAQKVAGGEGNSGVGDMGHTGDFNLEDVLASIGIDLQTATQTSDGSYTTYTNPVTGVNISYANGSTQTPLTDGLSASTSSFFGLGSGLTGQGEYNATHSSYNDSPVNWLNSTGAGLVLSGAKLVPKQILPYLGLRGFVTPGATRFTSVASATLRAVIPNTMSKVSWLPRATSLGGQFGRAVPLAGWLILALDLQWKGVHYSIENAPENMKDGILLGYSLGL